MIDDFLIEKNGQQRLGVKVAERSGYGIPPHSLVHPQHEFFAEVIKALLPAGIVDMLLNVLPIAPGIGLQVRQSLFQVLSASQGQHIGFQEVRYAFF